MKDGNCGLVVVCITVIRRREDSQGKGPIVLSHLVLVALAIHFVSPDDEIELIVFEEALALDGTVEIAAAPQFIVLELV